jgi:hypothetical protein
MCGKIQENDRNDGLPPSRCGLGGLIQKNQKKRRFLSERHFSAVIVGMAFGAGGFVRAANRSCQRPKKEYNKDQAFGVP